MQNNKIISLIFSFLFVSVSLWSMENDFTVEVKNKSSRTINFPIQGNNPGFKMSFTTNKKIKDSHDVSLYLLDKKVTACIPLFHLNTKTPNDFYYLNINNQKKLPTKIERKDKTYSCYAEANKEVLKTLKKDSLKDLGDFLFKNYNTD